MEKGNMKYIFFILMIGCSFTANVQGGKAIITEKKESTGTVQGRIKDKRDLQLLPGSTLIFGQNHQRFIQLSPIPPKILRSGKLNQAFIM
jgi:hypothetical protein